MATTAVIDPARQETLERIKNLILSDLSKHYTIPELASKFHISQIQLKTEFKELFSFTIYRFLEHERIKQSKKALEQTSQTVAEIAWQHGYHHPTNFTATFKRKVGMTPTEYRDSIQAKTGSVHPPTIIKRLRSA